jgi:hypothetical protein
MRPFRQSGEPTGCLKNAPVRPFPCFPGENLPQCGPMSCRRSSRVVGRCPRVRIVSKSPPVFSRSAGIFQKKHGRVRPPLLVLCSVSLLTCAPGVSRSHARILPSHRASPTMADFRPHGNPPLRYGLALTVPIAWAFRLVHSDRRLTQKSLFGKRLHCTIKYSVVKVLFTPVIISCLRKCNRHPAAFVYFFRV